MRAEPSDRSEMVSQLLFGECYAVADPATHPKWLKISTAHDRYEGWIDRFQHFSLTLETYENTLAHSHFLCSQINWAIRRQKPSQPMNLGAEMPYQDTEDRMSILPGSRLPFLDNTRKALFDETDFSTGTLHWTASGNFFQNTSQAAGFPEIKKFALLYLNAPYLWGGRTPFGIDCSGLTQVVFSLCGISLLRDSRQQASHGIDVPFDDRQPGDLAFFSNSEGNVIHVGILLENDAFIHASSRVRVDRLDPIGIFCLERRQYSHHLHSLRRYL